MSDKVSEIFHAILGAELTAVLWFIWKLYKEVKALKERKP